MEEVIDCTAPNSPEELAIHFLLRHAACRMALNGQVDEDALLQALARSRAAAAAMRPVATPAGERAPVAAGDRTTNAEVTNDDSCAARFSRAYAAARHLPASARANWGARAAA